MTTKVTAAMLAADVDEKIDALIAGAIAAIPEQEKMTGDVIQSARFATGEMSTGTVVHANANVPAITEGNQVMALSFTPISATSKLRIRVVSHCGTSVAATICMASLHAGGPGLAAAAGYCDTVAGMRQLVIDHEMVAGTTSAIPFTVRQGIHLAGTMTFNGTGGIRRFGGVLCSHITIDEIKA